MIFQLIQKIIFCLGRRILKKEDSLVSFLAGFLAGYISLAYKSKEYRAKWGLFFLSRAIDCIYKS